MPKKKTEEFEAEENTADVSQDEATGETGVEAHSENVAVEASVGNNLETETTTDDKPKRARKAKSDDAPNADEPQSASIGDTVVDVVSTVVGGLASAVADGVSAVVSAVTPDSAATDEPKSHHSKRAEKIGIVQSDKMTKTVTVRVDRVVKHPVYRKYIKRRKKFMAHDELGATVGDKVRIMETRPLSARKRWRVVEIVQKAVK